MSNQPTLWKIQLPSASGGWGDLKESENDGPYEVATFSTEAEALEEAEDIASILDDWEYRVVPVSTASDINFYD